MENKILGILAQLLECEVNKETSQENCDNWDSIKQLSLVVELEKEFDVMFETEEIKQMKRYQDIISILSKKV